MGSENAVCTKGMGEQVRDDMEESGLEQLKNQMREEVKMEMRGQLDAIKKLLQDTLKLEMEERERIKRIRKNRGIVVCIESNVFTIILICTLQCAVTICMIKYVRRGVISIMVGDTGVSSRCGCISQGRRQVQNFGGVIWDS